MAGSPLGMAVLGALLGEFVGVRRLLPRVEQFPDLRGRTGDERGHLRGYRGLRHDSRRGDAHQARLARDFSYRLGDLSLYLMRSPEPFGTLQSSLTLSRRAVRLASSIGSLSRISEQSFEEWILHDWEEKRER